jgi:hypothetical protein
MDWGFEVDFTELGWGEVLVQDGKVAPRTV